MPASPKIKLTPRQAEMMQRLIDGSVCAGWPLRFGGSMLDLSALSRQQRLTMAITVRGCYAGPYYARIRQVRHSLADKIRDTGRS